MTGGVRRRRRGLRVSRAVQAEQHHHHQARGEHGPCHPAGRGAREARESGDGDKSSPRRQQTWQDVAGEGAVDVRLSSRCKSFLAATWTLSEGGNGWPRGRGGAGRGGTPRGGARPTALPVGGCEPAGAGRRAAGTAGAPRRGTDRGEAGGERGARGIAPGSPAPLPTRRRSTQGALAQLLQRGCKLRRADWLSSSRPLLLALGEVPQLHSSFPPLIGLQPGGLFPLRCAISPRNCVGVPGLNAPLCFATGLLAAWSSSSLVTRATQTLPHPNKIHFLLLMPRGFPRTVFLGAAPPGLQIQPTNSHNQGQLGVALEGWVHSLTHLLMLYLKSVKACEAY